MTNMSETVKLPMKLLIDTDKNKVVVAEAGKDFVDVLFSFLTLPMGTIVRLLEKHRTTPQVVVGCFNNLYKSVSEMGLESFQTESCIQMLLYPRSVKHDEYTRIKLKIDDTEAVKYFVCPHFVYGEPSFYIISNTEECGYCGISMSLKSIKKLMNLEIQGLGEEQVQERGLRDDYGVFVRCDTSLFIITDDLKVASSSADYVLNTVKGLGYKDTYKLSEIRLDVGFNEVLTLLQCLFTSNSPLTDTFLKKKSSGDQTITFKAFARKQESKLLCVECGADFIDLLFTFLALPLENVWEITGNDLRLGCIGNLFKSFKSFNKRVDASSSSMCLLPSYYKCPKQLLDIVTEKSEIYYSFKRDCEGGTYDLKFTRKTPYDLAPQKRDCEGGTYDLKFTRKTPYDLAPRRYVRFTPLGAKGVLNLKNLGFVKRGTSFLVTDDLVVTPVSNTSLLKLKIQLEAKDIEEQVITIGKSEAITLLRASLMTSSALTTCLWNFMAKKIKEET